MELRWVKEEGAGGFSLGGERDSVWDFGQSHRLWLREAFSSPEHFLCTQDVQLEHLKDKLLIVRGFFAVGHFAVK